MLRCIRESNVKREYKLINKPIPTRVWLNYFHYGLIDTLKHFFTKDAIRNGAILYAELKGKLNTSPKERKMILKILWTLGRTSMPLFALVYDPLRESSIE